MQIGAYAMANIVPYHREAVFFHVLLHRMGDVGDTVTKTGELHPLPERLLRHGNEPCRLVADLSAGIGARAVPVEASDVGAHIHTDDVAFLGTSSESETIIIQLSNLLSQHGIFFALIAGLVLAGILASTMSTADSQLLAAASSVSHDLVQDFFGKKLNPKASMLAARGTVIGIAIVGIFLAWNPDSSVFQIVSFAWAGFGSAFGPVVLFALFWKRTNKQGAIAGMVAGGAMVFIWKYLVAPMGGAWAIYELLPAFLVACLVIVVVSLLTPPPSQEIVEEFEAVGK